MWYSNLSTYILFIAIVKLASCLPSGGVDLKNDPVKFKYETGVLKITIDTPPQSQGDLETLVSNLLARDDMKHLNSSLLKRDDPCDQKAPNFNGQFVRGCNKHLLAEDGKCPFRAEGKDCATFCETRRKFFYGKEIPYDAEVILNGPGAPERSLSKGVSVSWGVSLGLTAGLADPTGVASGGIGFDISKEVSYSLDQDFHATNMKNWCGYFTFVPKTVQSCGSITKFGQTEIVGPNGAVSKVCDEGKVLETLPDKCVSYPFRTPNGNGDGVTLVVYTRCDLPHFIAPMREQNEIYRQPEVADLSPKTHEKNPFDP
ncbi:hypothetical protein H072_5654 [Dactylellina haptotyla CBS 200.50]|uniref:Uncharacterized protein n=1 Tax=Dactylellina haptotyla (strain CBS 200.50) TaxID=1284197 RepID=S8AH65_DACHA|nr:hypothetical protein H072_5654 [Dactylellina haptotyla CBS 200.50]